MVVQHNMQAMNANRMLNTTTTSQAKSTEKLSSGYRINRAADDAAGLSISEKMRKQIRGLSQASDNAQDGISCVQTAEGALTEVHSMLQRMNELSVQAGNGTMSTDDRQNIQDEIDQLVTEIDRVSETTKFNETYLLKGDDTSNGNSIVAAQATVIGTIGGLEITQSAATSISDNQAVNLGTVKMQTSDAKFAIGTEATLVSKDVASVSVKTFNTGAANAGTIYTITKNDGSTVDVTGDKLSTDYGITSTATAAGQSADFTKYLDTTAGNTAGYTFAGSYTASLDSYAVGDVVTTTASVNNGKAALTLGDKKALTLSFQVGSDTTADNKIDVKIDSMSAKGIGVDGIKVTGKDSTNADAAVNTIDAAIKTVSKQRSALGAAQNRLEHTISNLDNVVENTTSAESAIRDVDMAEEMVEYSKNNILAQAGQSMLAQANQSTQGVLSLLQ